MIRLDLTPRPLDRLELAPLPLAALRLGTPSTWLDLTPRPLCRLRLPDFPATEEEARLMFGPNEFLEFGDGDHLTW